MALLLLSRYELDAADELESIPVSASFQGRLQPQLDAVVREADLWKPLLQAEAIELADRAKAIADRLDVVAGAGNQA